MDLKQKPPFFLVNFASFYMCTEISLSHPLMILVYSKDNSLGFRFHIGFVEVAGVEQKLYGILGKQYKKHTHPKIPSSGDPIRCFKPSKRRGKSLFL